MPIIAERAGFSAPYEPTFFCFRLPDESSVGESLTRLRGGGLGETRSMSGEGERARMFILDDVAAEAVV